MDNRPAVTALAMDRHRHAPRCNRSRPARSHRAVSLGTIAAECEANDHQAVARIDTAVRGMPHCTTASLLTSADRTRLERPKSSALLATPAYLGPGANR